MAVTRLQRKHRRNRARANQRVANIKLLTATPVIKNVDIEEIKASFEKAAPKAKATKAKKEAEESAE
jgi:hypothetical protein